MLSTNSPFGRAIVYNRVNENKTVRFVHRDTTIGRIITSLAIAAIAGFVGHLFLSEALYIHGVFTFLGSLFILYAVHEKNLSLRTKVLITAGIVSVIATIIFLQLPSSILGIWGLGAIFLSLTTAKDPNAPKVKVTPSARKKTSDFLSVVSDRITKEIESNPNGTLGRRLGPQRARRKQQHENNQRELQVKINEFKEQAEQSLRDVEKMRKDHIQANEQAKQKTLEAIETTKNELVKLKSIRIDLLEQIDPILSCKNDPNFSTPGQLNTRLAMLFEMEPETFEKVKKQGRLVLIYPSLKSIEEDKRPEWIKLAKKLYELDKQIRGKQSELDNSKLSLDLLGI